VIDEPLTAVTLPLVGAVKFPPPKPPLLPDGRFDGRSLGLKLGRFVGRVPLAPPVPPARPAPPKPVVQLPFVGCEMVTLVIALLDADADGEDVDEPAAGVELAVTHSPTFTAESATLTVWVILVDEV